MREEGGWWVVSRERRKPTTNHGQAQPWPSGLAANSRAFQTPAWLKANEPGRSGSSQASEAASGSVKVKVLPTPISLSTQIRPPMISTYFLQK